MEEAIVRAKSTLKIFFDAFCNPTAEQTGFLLKVYFEDDQCSEHIWLADLEFTGPLPSGVIANEPSLSGLSFMQRIAFDPSQISDWMFVDSGRLVGGFTTRVIRDRMTPEERAELDAASPYKF